MADVTREGEVLIKNWLHSQERVCHLKSQLNGAECDSFNAECALGKWLMPDDMKVGEKVAAWEGDSLFQVEKLENGDGKVTIARAAKPFSAWLSDREHPDV